MYYAMFIVFIIDLSIFYIKYCFFNIFCDCSIFRYLLTNKLFNQKDFLRSILSPSSSQSFFITHIFLNVVKAVSKEPPEKHKVFLSYGEYNFNFKSFLISFFNSLINLSGKSYIKVVPPLNTISEYNLLLKSISHLLIDYTKSSAHEGYSSPIFSGENKGLEYPSCAELLV
jgi:hypothetical protein